MIRTMICNRNHHLLKDLPHDTAKTMLVDGDEIIWLDVEAPSEQEIKQLSEQFTIHPLAIEDITKAHQRPKIDIYDDFYFIVFYDIDYVEEGNLLDEHELAIIIGKDFLITVHHEPIEEIAEVAARFRRNTKEIERGIGVLLYSLLDTIVDHYFPVLDRIGERIEELEEQVIEYSGGENTAGIRDIFSLKRELVHLRRQIAPQRDATAVLARRELPIISEATGVYFQDLYEHVLRVTDAIDVYRELLSGVFEAYLSVNSNKLATASNNLNAVMKRLTSYSIILMSVTLIAGIYGMNFDIMPELHWQLGYPFSLGLMLVVAAILALIFKRKKWF